MTIYVPSTHSQICLPSTFSRAVPRFQIIHVPHSARGNTGSKVYCLKNWAIPYQYFAYSISNRVCKICCIKATSSAVNDMPDECRYTAAYGTMEARKDM